MAGVTHNFMYKMMESELTIILEEEFGLITLHL